MDGSESICYRDEKNSSGSKGDVTIVTESTGESRSNLGGYGDPFNNVSSDHFNVTFSRCLSTRQERKTIGIICGSGPEAGVDLWKKCLEINQSEVFEGHDYKGDRDAVTVTIFSRANIGGPHGVFDMCDPVEGEILFQNVCDAIISINNQCDFFCICCNTLHYFEERIRDWMESERLRGIHLAEFVSIIESTKEELDNFARRCGRKTEVAVLGSFFVTDLNGISPYKNLASDSIILRDVGPDLRKIQQDVIVSCKAKGSKDQEVIHKMQTVVDAVTKSEENGYPPLLVLACTEFPLIALHFNGPVIDPTLVLARKLVHLSHGW